MSSESAPRPAERPGKKRLRAAIVKVHRWLGIFGCVSFVVWFVSGAVLVYVHFPAMTAAEKLETLPPIRWDAVRLPPRAALQAAALTQYPRQFWLEMAGSEPVYRMQDWNGEFLAVSGRDGRRIDGVPPERALHTVRRNLDAPDATLRRSFLGSDQWTVAGYWDRRRPFHVIELNDGPGTEYYVQAGTGEIVLDTQRAERWWNYAGAIPHWIYFPFLRRDTGTWTWVVCLLAAAGTLSAVTGIWVGVSSLRRNRAGASRSSRYRGWLKWHQVTGLVGGVAVLLWIVTGLLSMYPGGFLEQRGITDAEYRRYAGTTTPDFPLEDIHRLDRGAGTAHFTWIGGQPFVVFDRGTRHAAVYDVDRGRALELDDATLFAAARSLLPDTDVAFRRRLQTGDEYWHTGFTVKRLPILRIGFDDPERTWFHIDPRSGEVVGLLDATGRIDRWWNWGIHDVDFAFLLRNRPLWDVVILSLLGLGLAVSVTSVAIAAKRVLHVRKTSARQRPGVAESRKRRQEEASASSCVR